jgi:hypothetical protein
MFCKNSRLIHAMAEWEEQTGADYKEVTAKEVTATTFDPFPTQLKCQQQLWTSRRMDF